MLIGKINGIISYRQIWKSNGIFRGVGTQVIGNLCHEYGFNQKQSSCVFMAKSMETNITGNIMFNAGAHINQNVSA